MNRLTLDPDIEDLGLEAGAAAGLTGHEHISEEDHLHLDVTGAFALLAATTFEVERKCGRGVLPPAGFRLGSKQLAHLVEGTDVGNRVGAGDRPMGL